MSETSTEQAELESAAKVKQVREDLMKSVAHWQEVAATGQGAAEMAACYAYVLSALMREMAEDSEGWRGVDAARFVHDLVVNGDTDDLNGDIAVPPAPKDLIDEVRQLHRPIERSLDEDEPTDEVFCLECDRIREECSDEAEPVTWPCPTIKSLNDVQTATSIADRSVNITTDDLAALLRLAANDDLHAVAGDQAVADRLGDRLDKAGS